MLPCRNEKYFNEVKNINRITRSPTCDQDSEYLRLVFVMITQPETVKSRSVGQVGRRLCPEPREEGPAGCTRCWRSSRTRRRTPVAYKVVYKRGVTTRSLSSIDSRTSDYLPCSGSKRDPYLSALTSLVMAPISCFASRGIHMLFKSRSSSLETPITASIDLKTRPLVS